MSSVIQSPWTLREAATKKGRCSVSGNGPLTFPRLLDVVADAAFVAGNLDAESLFRKCGVKLETSEHKPNFGNKPDAPISCQAAVCGSAPCNSHRSS